MGKNFFAIFQHIVCEKSTGSAEFEYFEVYLQSYADLKGIDRVITSIHNQAIVALDSFCLTDYFLSIGAKLSC